VTTVNAHEKVVTFEFPGESEGIMFFGSLNPMRTSSREKTLPTLQEENTITIENVRFNRDTVQSILLAQKVKLSRASTVTGSGFAVYRPRHLQEQSHPDQQPSGVRSNRKVPPLLLELHDRACTGQNVSAAFRSTALDNLASAESAGDLNAFLTSDAFETPTERLYRNRLCALLHGHERLSTADFVKIVPARSLASFSNEFFTPEQSQQVQEYLSGDQQAVPPLLLELHDRALTGLGLSAAFRSTALDNLASAERAGDLNAFLTSDAFERLLERVYRNRLCALLHGRERLSTADLVKIVPARSLATL